MVRSKKTETVSVLFSFKKYIYFYLFIWLHQVLVVACRIFNLCWPVESLVVACKIFTCGMRDIVP